MNIVELARFYRALIESLVDPNLNDEEALQYIGLFPVWDATATYAEGVRCRYMDKLYRCIQPHTAQAEWNPAVATALWAEVLPGQEGTEIGEWVQPDSTNPYNTGDRVIFEGHIYESVIDGNIWSPAAYPAGWLLF